MPMKVDIRRLSIPFETKAKTKPPSVSGIAKSTKDTATLRTLSMVAKNVLKIVTTLIADLSTAKNVMNNFMFTADIIQLVGTVQSIHVIVQEAKSPTTQENKKEKILKIASASLGLALATLTSFEVMKKFNLFDISAEMGKIPTIGGAAVFLPFGSFMAVIQIVKNAIDIGIAAHKIKKLNVKMLGNQSKQDFWSKDIQVILQQKLPKMREKLQLMAENKELKAEVETAVSEYTRLKGQYDKKNTELKELTTKNPLSILRQKNAVRSAKQQLIKASQKYQHLYKNYEGHIQNYNAKENKIIRLETLQSKINNNALTETDQDSIAELKTNKLAKWKVKKEIINWEKTTIKMGIGLNVITIVALVAMIVLNGTGIGLLVTALTLASVFILLTIAGYGLDKFKKYHQIQYFSVPIPEF